MNRKITEKPKDLMKIAAFSFKGKMIEALLFVLVCRLILEIPGLIFVFLPAKFQTVLIANILNIYALFVNGPIALSMHHYFVMVFRGETNQGTKEIRFGFKNLSKALILFIRIRLVVYLWSLFFIIPGIIASINYSQSFFILSDNPEKSTSTCMLESKYIMRGNKLAFVRLLICYLPIYIVTSLPAYCAHFVLDGESIRAMQAAIAQNDIYTALMQANVMHPIAQALLLLGFIATAVVMPARIAFYDLLSGKLVIERSNNATVSNRPEEHPFVHTTDAEQEKSEYIDWIVEKEPEVYSTQTVIDAEYEEVDENEKEIEEDNANE